MFQNLAIPFHAQSLPIAVNSSPNPTSLHYSRRAFTVRCRATTADGLPRCLVESHNPASLYEVLKVKQSASPADIKKAYRRLAKIYHPDAAAERSPDGSDFIQIHDAYETLSDPKARAVYDISIGSFGSGRRAVARSAGTTSPFGRYGSSCSSSSTPTATVGRRPGFYQTRRWETDQCW